MLQPRAETMAKPTLQEAVTEYLSHLSAKGLALGTVKNRHDSLRALVRSAGNVLVWNITAKHLDRVFTVNSHWASGTRNNRLYHYKHFFGWCRARGYMHRDSDPAFGWSNVKVARKDKMMIPVSEWGTLIDMCETPNERIVIATGLFLFLRGSEQQLLQLKHVHLDDLEIQVFRKKTTDWDVMPISLELAGYLREHLTYLATMNAPKPDHYLIPTNTPPQQRLNGRFVKGSCLVNPDRPFLRPYDVVKAVLGRAGYPTFREGEHTMRRSGARAYFDTLVDSGYDGALRHVQAMLGHEHAEMTERYLGLRHDRIKRNARIKGKPMFPALQDAKVIPIRREL